jgi:hypothetical protein
MREDAVGKRQLLDHTGHSIEHSFPPLERCEISSNRHPALAFCLSMIFSDLPSPAEACFAKAGNRLPLFGIMLLSEHDLFRKPVTTFRDHALSGCC